MKLESLKKEIINKIKSIDDIEQLKYIYFTMKGIKKSS